jgi:hypothetical protein
VAATSPRLHVIEIVAKHLYRNNLINRAGLAAV